MLVQLELEAHCVVNIHIMSNSSFGLLWACHENMWGCMEVGWENNYAFTYSSVTKKYSCHSDIIYV